MTSPLDKLSDRYHNDALFHAVVDALRGLIVNLQLTPSEVREAAMFACYIEEIHRTPVAVSFAVQKKDPP